MRRGTRATRFVLICLSLLLGILPPLVSWSAWGPDPVALRSTTDWIRPISACSDGAFGSFVAWQEESTFAKGRLRALHLLPTGDLDPAWPPGGALVGGNVLNRGSLEVISDGSSGVYLLWSEPGAIRITHLVADGTPAPGWPEDGISIGTGVDPVAIPDGSGGMYVGWTRPVAGPDTEVPSLQRIDANGVAPGWPAGGLMLREADPVKTVDRWVRLAPGPDGDVYATWITMSADTLSVPDAAWLARIGSEGQVAAGWPLPGIALEPFRWAEATGAPLVSAPIAIAPDGRGGVFHVIESPYRWIGPPPYEYLSATSTEIRLRRLQSSGEAAAGWPARGRVVEADYLLPDFPEDAPDLFYDRSDGAFLGIFGHQSDGPDYTSYEHWTDTGSGTYAGQADPAEGRSVIVRDSGSLALAMFSPDVTSSFFYPPALLRGDYLPGGVYETHNEPGTAWYGDVALVPTGDGGTIFFWSQNNEIHGLFARRFGAGGEVVDVPAADTSNRPCRAWFAPGEGIRAAWSLDATEGAHLELFDLSGRRLASAHPAPGAFDIILPGTARLAAGVYFLRARTGGSVRTARVAVLP